MNMDAARPRIVDSHIHFGTDPHVASQTCVPYLRPDDPASVIRCLDEQGASHGVLFPHDRVMTPPWDADYDTANMQVGAAVKAYPERIVGVARINPTFGARHTRELLDKYVGDWNCRGIKLVAGYDFYRPNDMSLMAPLLEKAVEHDLTVLFHSGDAPRDLPSLQAKAAMSFPMVRFVLAHIGMHLFLWEAIIASQEHDNITVDMSQAFPFDIKTFVTEVGVDRLTYGSDAPYQSPLVEQSKCGVIDLTPEELDQVLFATAARVWKIESK
jgi:predicted TIM-barrel fold metal-dependent hydrolase